MEQQIIMNERNTNQVHLKQIFDEFKFHLIYKNNTKPVQTNGCEQLKNLLSEIKRECKIKRDKKKNMYENLHHLQQTQKKQRPASTLQSRIWKPKQIDLDSLEAVKEEVLIIEKQKETLLQEISQLESSLGTIKKNVAQVKKNVEIESSKAEKYKHISYLSKSIQRQTDTNKIINYRSYKKLVKCQEDAISNLKKFKTNLRKGNEDLESRYIQFKQKHENQQICKSKLDYTACSSNKLECSSDVKIDKSFISKLEELIQLFKQKQSNFEEIKAEQTTKIRLKKIQKNYLKEDRIKLHEIIDRFQQSHDVKIQSLPNLIIYIYKRLNQDNEQMENLCIKHYQIKEVLLEDLQKLKQKQEEIQQQSSKIVTSSFIYENDKKQKIARNSEMFIKLLALLHNLLGKFKYLFTMALTLNIEKKNFQELLIQITNIYKFDSIFYQKDVQETNIMTVYDNLTNFKEMQAILSQHQLTNSLDKNDLLSLIFSDLRYTLMFRRCWLEQQIKEGFEEDMLLQKICAIQERCQQLYESKLKIFIHLLVSSLKALNMNKYEKKMIASSNARDSLFLSIPKPIKVINFEENDEIEASQSKQNSQQVRKFNSESSQEDIPNFQFKDNPRKIINLLQGLKNDEKKIFKPFNFQSSQVYMYDNKVVLPKYIF